MYAKSFYTQYLNTDAFSGKRLAEPYSEHLYVVQNPPSKPLSVTEMDDIYDLPYMRTYHPSYKAKGGIPAISEIRFSLISNRDVSEDAVSVRLHFTRAYCTGQKS